MSSGSEKGDLKPSKTDKALGNALSSLLRRQNFRKMTVRDICEEATVSRATFYAHYIDKYDLLKDWLNHISIDQKAVAGAEELISRYIELNEVMLMNIVSGADNETLLVLHAHLYRQVSTIAQLNDMDTTGGQQVKFIGFIAGALVYYLLQQDNSRFTLEVRAARIFEIIEKLLR